MSKNKYKVSAYISAGIIHSFPARSLNHAREIASRIILEGLWTEPEEDGSETFFPSYRVYKVKVTVEQ